MNNGINYKIHNYDLNIARNGDPVKGQYRFIYVLERTRMSDPAISIGYRDNYKISLERDMMIETADENNVFDIYLFNSSKPATLSLLFTNSANMIRIRRNI